MTRAYGSFYNLGAHASMAAALAYIQANRWDSNLDGSGTPVQGMEFFHSTIGATMRYTGGAWRLVPPFDITDADCQSDLWTATAGNATISSGVGYRQIEAAGGVDCSADTTGGRIEMDLPSCDLVVSVLVTRITFPSASVGQYCNLWMYDSREAYMTYAYGSLNGSEVINTGYGAESYANGGGKTSGGWLFHNQAARTLGLIRKGGHVWAVDSAQLAAAPKSSEWLQRGTRTLAVAGTFPMVSYDKLIIIAGNYTGLPAFTVRLSDFRAKSL